MDLSLIFNLANLFALPFWTLMILLPNWGITRKVMASYIPFVLLAGLYLYLLSGTLDGESVAVLANPTLPDIARLFAQEKIALTGWVHFIIFDLFVGRYIYWQGQKSGVGTVHSLILCLFAGPLGLLSHVLTRWIQGKWSDELGTDSSEVSPSSS